MTTTDTLADLKRATKKRQRREEALREVFEEIDELLLRAREEGTMPEAARILGVRREWAWRRVQRYEERRNGKHG